MTVLVGTDAAHRHFNRSATGGQSDRTVKSYSLLDTKREENGVQQYRRQTLLAEFAPRGLFCSRSVGGITHAMDEGKSIVAGDTASSLEAELPPFFLKI